MVVGLLWRRFCAVLGLRVVYARAGMFWLTNTGWRAAVALMRLKSTRPSLRASQTRSGRPARIVNRTATRPARAADPLPLSLTHI
mgnify:CR=1 FL=1